MGEKVKHVWRAGEGREEPIAKLLECSRKVVLDGESVGAREVTLAHCDWAPHTSWHARHRHAEAEEIMYIISGRFVGGVGGDGKEVELGPGDILWVPRGEVHWGYNPFPERTEMLVIYTRPSLKEIGYEVLE